MLECVSEVLCARNVPVATHLPSDHHTPKLNQLLTPPARDKRPQDLII